MIPAPVRLAAIFFLLPAIAAAKTEAPPGDPGALKVAKMVEFIKNNKKPRAKGPKKEFALTQDEVNAYIQSWIQDSERNGRNKEVSVKSAAVRFEPGRVVQADAVAQVAAGSLKMLDSLGDSLMTRKLKELLTIDNTVHLQCVLGAAKGKGFLVVQEVRIKGIPVPISMVRAILDLVGKKQHPPLDFAKPMSLPNGIQKVDILPQALKLEVAA